MGLESGCSCDHAWLRAVARIDGARIAALGYHSYPYGGSLNESLQRFLDPLVSTKNITSTYADVRATIAGLCARCPQLPIFLHEYNAGPGSGHTNFSGTYANALFLAASTVQALRANVSQFTIFNLQSNLSTYGYAMMNLTDNVGPTGLLFSKVLNHLVRGSVFGTHLNTTVPSVWSVLTENGARGSLLVVNANLTQSIRLPTG
jgi:hypothetical protein